MVDLIDRECLKAYKGSNATVNKDFINGWNSAIEAIYNTAKSVSQQKSVWIPCKDRLPEEMVDVLAYDGVDMFVAYLLHDRWASTDKNFDIYTDIIVWMPLPEPWKDGE